MSPTIRNVLAVVAGLVVGFIVNFGLVTISPSIVPPPEGVDPNDIEQIKANIHLYQPKHFIMPFLAHALGTLAGAFTAARLAVSRHMLLAGIIGGFFLAGGIAMVKMLPGSPMAFNALDLIVAYLPMAWLGAKLGTRKTSDTAE